jgi:hypothetical protein
MEEKTSANTPQTPLGTTSSAAPGGTSAAEAAAQSPSPITAYLTLAVEILVPLVITAAALFLAILGGWDRFDAEIVNLLPGYTIDTPAIVEAVENSFGAENFSAENDLFTDSSILDWFDESRISVKSDMRPSPGQLLPAHGTESGSMRLRLDFRDHDFIPVQSRLRLGDSMFVGNYGKCDMFLAAIYDDRLTFFKSAPATPQPAAAIDIEPGQRQSLASRSDTDSESSPRLLRVSAFSPPPNPSPNASAEQQSYPGAQKSLPRPEQASPSFSLRPAETPTPMRTKRARRVKRAPVPSIAYPQSPSTFAPFESAIPSPAPSATAVSPPSARPIRSGSTAITTAQIVTSAAVSALIQADLRGAKSIVFAPLGTAPGGLSYDEAVDAIDAGVQIAFIHLSSIRRFFIHIASSNLVTGEHRLEFGTVQHLDPSVTFVSWLMTPLPFPGGLSLFKPQVVAVNQALPPAGSLLVNPLFLIAEGNSPTSDWLALLRSRMSTPLPAVGFLAIGLLAIGLGTRRSSATMRTRPTLRGFGDGVALTALLAITLGVLWHFWIWFPESWFASASGLTCFALSAGAVAGGLISRGRAVQPMKEEPEPRKVLRSVLYRDLPVDDVKRDRLGFAPLVEALRSFLNNPDTTPPMVLSVNGPWGSGKSSVMKMLGRELKRTGRFSVVWFNASQFHREEQILAAFLQSIAHQLSQDWGPLLAVKLGLVRWKNTSLLKQVGILALLALAIVGYFRDDLREAIGNTVKTLTGEQDTATLKVVKGGATLGLVAWVAWSMQILWPFRLRLGSFFSVSDQSSRIGFLAEFTREFRLYREAVGDRKFLFLVDDLDRCQPDRVVDVLRTINLIITSGDDAGQSYFVLGYDQSYVVRAVELHFKELAQAGLKRGERFGLQYLKKMVTISVSVPRADEDKIANLLKYVDRVEDPKADAQSRKLLQRVKRVVMDRSSAKRAASFLAFAMLVSLVFVWPKSGPTGSPIVAESPRNSIQPSAAPTPSSGREPIDLPTPETPAELYGERALLIVPALLLLAAAAALLAANRPMEIEKRYIRQDVDSTDFVNAIKRCRDLLPDNPRDAIRMVNLMRMEYLVQESPDAPLNGAPLKEWDCVSFTILEKLHPEYFQRKFVNDVILPAIKNSTGAPLDVRALYSQITPNPPVTSSMTADMETLIAAGGSLDHMCDADKLLRYVDVNTYLLEAEL